MKKPLYAEGSLDAAVILMGSIFLAGMVILAASCHDHRHREGWAQKVPKNGVSGHLKAIVEVNSQLNKLNKEIGLWVRNLT